MFLIVFGFCQKVSMLKKRPKHHNGLSQKTFRTRGWRKQYVEKNTVSKRTLCQTIVWKFALSAFCLSSPPAPHVQCWRGSDRMQQKSLISSGAHAKSTLDLGGRGGRDPFAGKPFGKQFNLNCFSQLCFCLHIVSFNRGTIFLRFWVSWREKCWNCFRTSS